MSTPLEIWKKAKTDFQNKTGKKKPGSWFTSGTESAIKAVLSACDTASSSQVKAGKVVTGLHEKIEAVNKKAEQETLKLTKKMETVFLNLDLKIDSELGEEQKKKLSADREKLEKYFSEQKQQIVSKEEKEVRLLEDKLNKFQQESIKKNEEALKKALEKWTAHYHKIKKQFEDAAKSTDHEFNHAITHILVKGLSDTDEAVQSRVEDAKPVKFEKVDD